ncbi:MAG: hypothetical protein MRZ79_06035 [Bacteroidia bacterium]|nr:hypothetical protein [Bacteroidia bacterium]
MKYLQIIILTTLVLTFNTAFSQKDSIEIQSKIIEMMNTKSKDTKGVKIGPLKIPYVNPDSIYKTLHKFDYITSDDIEKACKYGKWEDRHERNCPHGDKRRHAVPIVYGYPTRKTLKKAQAGKFYLGGCVFTECEPSWYCKKHKTEF